MNGPDPQTLYREQVLDHSRRPRNFRRLENADREAVGHNALCGDKLTLYVRMEGNRIGEVSFDGSGCAISLASASMLTEIVPGHTCAQALKAIAGVKEMFTANGDGTPPAGCEAMAALSAVRAYPARIRCAILPWRTLEAALAGEPDPVTTE